MQTEDLMPVDEFLIHYNVEVSFINSLNDFGLIEITRSETGAFIQKSQLHNLEKFVRLHYDMDINLEGIDAINNILHRVAELQLEINKLRNQLGLINN